MNLKPVRKSVLTSFLGKIFLVVFLLGMNLVPLLQATAPGEMNYQGKLADANGNPLTGTYDIQFQIFANPSGGVPLYNTTRNNVPVSQGVFTVVIGSATPAEAIPASIFQGGADRYLQINVGTTELLPRQKLTAAPYAMAVAAGSVGSPEMIDGTVALVDFNISDVDTHYVTTGTAQPISGLKIFTGVITAPGGNSTNWNTASANALNWDGGTANLNAVTGRASLGLGGLSTLNAVSGGAGGTITDNTIVNNDLASGLFGNITGVGTLGNLTVGGFVRVSNGTTYMEMTTPSTVLANRNVTFPDTSGTIAVLNTSTSDEVIAKNASAISVVPGTLFNIAFSNSVSVKIGDRVLLWAMIDISPTGNGTGYASITRSAPLSTGNGDFGGGTTVPNLGASFPMISGLGSGVTLSGIYNVTTAGTLRFQFDLNTNASGNIFPNFCFMRVWVLRMS